MPAATVPARGNAPTAAGVIGSYVAAIFPLARRELRRWHQRARAIADPELRRHALETLRAEHMNAEGAALFALLAAPHQRVRLVRALVAYQTMYDFLDTLTEQPRSAHAANSERLHRALTDALTPGGPMSDWYGLNRTREDGYLAALVANCRQGLALLPSFEPIRAAAVASARRAIEVQLLNHRPAGRRRAGLRAWGEGAAALDGALNWWEHAASACSTLDLHTLLGLAGDPATSARQVLPAVHYGTALCGLNTILESLIDLPADRLNGEHSYVGYYRSPGHAAERLGALVATTMSRSETLRRPQRHLAIAQAMVSMYLSRAEARSAESRPAAATIVAAMPQPLPSLIGLQRVVRSLRPAAT